MAFELWHYFAIAGIVFVVIEILTPTTFFVNLALACFVTAIASGVFMYLLRGLRHRKTVDAGTGMNRYVGQRAKVLEDVDDKGGVISIFDERWNARSIDGGKYVNGIFVRIVKEENLVMFVEEEK